ncbi:MMPL family transporter [Paenibacillus sp. MMS18-CY102]|uniref:MMPL family transporter n=1 Tax=Paenibacillus sp. MMS18-CY102 TaxID=2682849 RepID=UPI0013656DCD|nr:MMPL family transporter [Paenibacillus sp. MMS18-CY102]MWC28021.1 MMPL family transporter [Paenibacillus sp. MMS18-CY102]
MLSKLGKVSTAYPKTTVFIWLIILMVSIPFSSKLHDNLSGGDLTIAASESAQANQYIAQAFDGFAVSRLIIVVEHNSLLPSEAPFQEQVKKVEDKLKQNPSVSNIIDPYDTGRNQIDAASRRVFLYANLDMTEQQSRKFVKLLKQELPESAADGFKVLLTGSPALNAEGSQIAKDNVKMVEKIGLPFVFLLLLIVFRSFTAALLPLLTGMCAIIISMAGAYFFSTQMALSQLLTNIITMLGLGIAIDYALFMTQRFREELAAGLQVREAAQASVSTAGRSVFFAGATVAISMVSIVFSNTSYARSIALGGTIVVVASVAISITLLPAVLTLIGTKIDSLKLPILNKRRAAIKREPTAWQRGIRSVMKRPILFLLLALVPIGVFIPPLTNIELHLPAGSFDELPADSEARQGMEAVTAHAGAGATFPVKLLLKTQNNVFGQPSIDQLKQTVQQLSKLPNVQSVQSIVTLITPQRSAEQWQKLTATPTEPLPEQAKQALQPFVSRDGKSTILYVIPKTEAGSSEARTLVDAIRHTVVPAITAGISASVFGETAAGLDYDAEVLSHFPLIIGFVLLLTFVLLYAAFRSVIIPLKAIIMNLLVTASTLGFVVLMYQYGYMPGAEPFPLNINTPLTLFVLLFGLSMDYEVILISRMREQYRLTGQHQESVTHGIVSTVGIINGAASIMVVVFGVFLFADFQLIEELGVGLAFAILIDAFLVRTILVPVFMQLLGKANWWSFRDWFAILMPGLAKKREAREQVERRG